ncbi:MAG: ATP-dependent DNA helicase [Ferruginibacter sp.]|jgi:DNA helicase-2/ATP-dependent DNA helicase PcrA
MHHYKEKLQAQFQKIYNELNPQQRIAVDTIDGPVMVIAGPGTGKTQILAARIGKILLETDELPENILCLTYTDAGAVAMRSRLQKFIGADAYKVHIHTFHSFCNEIIQDNLFLFEKNSLDPITELEAIQLLEALIDGFPKGHPLKRYRGDVYYEINNLKNLFSAMKKEGWTAAFITQKTKEYLNKIEQDKLNKDFIYQTSRKGKFEKGDFKPDYYDEVERMKKLVAAAGEFEHYQQMMNDKNRYDFDDMINWIIEVFETNNNVLLNYQEKYHYILVDEYQDTSNTQNRLVQLLIEYWDVPNIFVVGDDDQSIFRFQGANVDNMKGIARRYADALIKVVLTTNYRSTQSLLKVSGSFIENNQERLINDSELGKLNKSLVSGNKKFEQQQQYLPQIIAYNSMFEEMLGITQKILQLVNEGTPPSSIAVLYRENKYGEELAKFLRLKNVPVYSKRSINLFEDAFINKILKILHYLNAEQDVPYGGDELLFEIMHYDFYQIPAIEIAKLTVEANNKKYDGEQTSLRKLLYDKSNAPAKDLFDKGLDEGLKNLSHVLEKLIAAVPNVSLQQLFSHIVNEAGVLHFIMNSQQKISLMQRLTALFDFIKTETASNPMLTLSGLMKILSLMKEEEIHLSMPQLIGHSNGVNLLTLHGSKGLEFEHVFIAGTTKDVWEKKVNKSRAYKLPDNIFSFVDAEEDGSPVNKKEEELRRLFYVGITRAETHLYLSYPLFKKDGKNLEPSMFIAEIMDKYPEIETQNISFTAEEIFEFQELQFLEQMPQIEPAEEEFISALLEKFTMNVTALNNYLKCPLQFYYQNLIRIPSGKNEATEFGSAVHYALEKLFRNMQDAGKEVFPPKEEMLANFSWYLKKHRENFTKEAFDRRMEYGNEVLTNYYNKYINTWNKVVAVERNIRAVVVNGIPLKGKLDKLEFNGNLVNVVDYKTGDIDKATPKLKAPNDKDPNGGDYWRQAVFYKILIDNYKLKNWRVESTEFDFIEPDKNKVYHKQKIAITPQDVETVEQQVTETWQKIQNREFYTGCGKPECYWCNFVKENKLQKARYEHEEQEE